MHKNPRYVAHIERLVARAQAGDMRALERLLSDTTPLVRHIIGHQDDPDDRDDLLHDVQLRICAKLRQYERRTHSQFLAWLTVVTRNIVRDDHRHRKTRLDHEREWARSALTEVPSDEPDPQVERLRDVLGSDRLTSAQRDVLAARYILDQDCATIARERGCAVGTVYKLLTQAYARIRADLAESET